MKGSYQYDGPSFDSLVEDGNGREIIARAMRHLLYTTGMHERGDQLAYELLVAVHHKFLLERRQPVITLDDVIGAS